MIFQKDKPKLVTELRVAPVAIMRGTLEKQGGNVKNWKERFWLLDSTGILAYFKDRSKGNSALGVINLSQVTVIIKGEDAGSVWPAGYDPKAGFGLETLSKRTYFVHASKEQEALSWRIALSIFGWMVRCGDHARGGV